MKRIFIGVLLLSNLSFAQYYSERSTQQSFEASDIYFNSYYLNTFGILNFRNVTPGLIDDPFLNLSVNPANIPSLENKNAIFYMDFRGDRTEAPVVSNYVMPMYYADVRMSSYIYPPVDRRWFYKTRTEPEPIVSFGVLTNPLKDITKNFFLGGTYQVLYNEDKFYTVPYGIYYPNVYYDALGARTAEANAYRSFPVQDKYAGKDEMITTGHFFSLFTGYKITSSLSFGLSLNGVIHTREGEYLNNYNDQRNYNSNYKNSSSNSQAKNEDYDHLDLSAGLNYQVTPTLKIGLKGGILDGTVNQDYVSLSSYSYSYNTPEVSEDWSYNISNSSTEQKWKQDGNTSYLGFNYNQKVTEKAMFNIYYKYSSEKTDLTNSTVINDTSFYSSRYYSSYDTSINSYGGYSRATDLRNGTGDRKRRSHEIMINLDWELTPVTNLYIGVYHKNETSETFSAEPVNAFRVSSSYANYSNRPQYNYNYFNSQADSKVLEWNYTADFSTLQIPVIFNFNFNDRWGVMLGINKVFNKWKITDETIGYFYSRNRNNNGVITNETNFGERYKQPVEHYTENSVKIISSFYVNISDQFSTRILLDPEFEHEFRIAQWWLSFGINI